VILMTSSDQQFTEHLRVIAKTTVVEEIAAAVSSAFEAEE
jgi:hypothetical protein